MTLKRKITASDNSDTTIRKQKKPKKERGSLSLKLKSKTLTRARSKGMAHTENTHSDLEELESDHEQDSPQDPSDGRQTRMTTQVKDLKMFLKHRCQSGSNVLLLEDFHEAGSGEKDADTWLRTVPYETIPISNSVVTFKNSEDTAEETETRNDLITCYLSGKYQEIYKLSKGDESLKKLNSGIKELKTKHSELTETTNSLKEKVQSISANQEADRKEIDKLKSANEELQGIVRNLAQKKPNVIPGEIPVQQQQIPTNNIDSTQEDLPNRYAPSATNPDTTRHSSSDIKAAMTNSKGNKHEAAFELLRPESHKEVIENSDTTLAYHRFCEMRQDKTWGPKFEHTIQQINRWLKTDAKVDFFIENKDCCFNIRIRDDDHTKNIITTDSSPAERDELVEELKEILTEAQIVLKDNLTLTSDHIDWERTKDASKSNMKMFVNAVEWEKEKQDNKWFRCYHIFAEKALCDAGIIPRIQASENRRRNQHGRPKFDQRIGLLKDPMLGKRCSNCGSNTHWSHECETPKRSDRPRSFRGRNQFRQSYGGYGHQRRGGFRQPLRSDDYVY